jgi:hypothetical protein
VNADRAGDATSPNRSGWLRSAAMSATHSPPPASITATCRPTGRDPGRETALPATARLPNSQKTAGPIGGFTEEAQPDEG